MKYRPPVGNQSLPIINYFSFSIIYRPYQSTTVDSPLPTIGYSQLTNRCKNYQLHLTIAYSPWLLPILASPTRIHHEFSTTPTTGHHWSPINPTHLRWSPPHPVRLQLQLGRWRLRSFWRSTSLPEVHQAQPPRGDATATSRKAPMIVLMVGNKLTDKLIMVAMMINNHQANWWLDNDGCQWQLWSMMSY